MKRRDILKKLQEAGFTFQEGANHTKIYSQDGKYCSALGRHAELDKRQVQKIEKQTGVKLQ